MDSKTTPATAADPLAAMFQNASIDKAERSEFSNSARDMFKFAVNNTFNFTKEGENLVLESSDVIDFFRNVVQPFLAEVRKNDQSRSTVGSSTGANGNDPIPQAPTTDHNFEGELVNVTNLVPQEPSSLPVTSVADLYTRSMLKCLAGYPLYEPQPLSEFSTEYMRNGVNVGDVGFVREDGVFDFLFNVCLPKNISINPPNLSDAFSLDTQDHSATRTARGLPHKTCLFQRPVTKTNSGEYICQGSEGAVLELPEGATKDEAMNIFPFEKLAARHGVQWYEYTISRGRKISNGSLYLITSFTKCSQWGIAVFDRPCAPGQGLKFEKKRSLPFGKSTSRYHWKGSHTFPTKVSNLNQADVHNQCVFLRGFKIMIRQDIFDSLYNDPLRGSDTIKFSSSLQGDGISGTRQRATRIRGGGDTSKKLIDRALLSWAPLSSITKSDEVVLDTNFNASLVHPSDFINAALLSQNRSAKVALTHDDVWCDLLRDNFPKLKNDTLMNIARSYIMAVDEYSSVTLEKISDVSSILGDSHRLSQGISIPAFHGSLTPLANDYTPVSDKIPATLPRELVERILLLLDTDSMLKCRLVDRAFNEIIQSSTLLQYILACKVAGVTDNPRSPLSYAERLEALKKREDAWRKLTPMFEIRIDVNHQTRSMVRLTGGILFIDDNNQKDLNYCRLPSSPQDNLHWIRIPGHGPALDWSGVLVNFLTAIDEHDLIVNFISSETGNQTNMQRHSLDFVLLKFSTGEYHPLAHQPRIHIQRSADADPAVMSKIVGDNLALIVNNVNDQTLPSILVIFDWKTGQKRLQHESNAGGAYGSLIFISPEFLLVPNRLLFHFEIWHIPHKQNDSNPPIQILSLQMPAVSSNYSISSFRCYGEPSPFLHSVPYLPSRPFYSSPENSIIMVPLRITSLSSGPTPSYNFIMHRRSLLDIIQKWTFPSLLEQREDQATWLTNEVVVLSIADSEDSSVRLSAQSKSVSRTPHSRSSPGSQRNSIDYNPLFVSSESPKTSRITFLQVPWAEWGPPITRWFPIDDTLARWLPFTNGQRYVFSEPSGHYGKKLTVNVLDFNPHNYRRNAEIMGRLRGEGRHEDSNGNYEEEKEEKEEEELDHGGVFSEEVYMGLNSVVYRAPDEYDFDLVWMDEERLFGVKLNRQGWEESIKVLYIG